MLDIRNRLYVFWDDNGTFSDLSQSLLDYSRDFETVGLSSSDDYLFVGFEKPINGFYVELETANTVANSFSLEYYNGTSFSAVDELLDESKGWTRSGFVSWARPVDSTTAQTIEEATTINSQEAFWYRIRPSADHDAGTQLRGLGVVFSDDRDIQEHEPRLVKTSFIPSGQNSHILSHVAARDEIIQDIRKRELSKKNSSNVFAEDIFALDLLDFKQLRMASKYKAMELIYNGLSDNPDDVYAVQSTKYKLDYEDAFKLFLLDLDLNDDGDLDSNDRRTQSSTRFTSR